MTLVSAAAVPAALERSQSRMTADEAAVPWRFAALISLASLPVLPAVLGAGLGAVRVPGVLPAGPLVGTQTGLGAAGLPGILKV